MSCPLLACSHEASLCSYSMASLSCTWHGMRLPANCPAPAPKAQGFVARHPSHHSQQPQLIQTHTPHSSPSPPHPILTPYPPFPEQTPRPHAPDRRAQPPHPTTTIPAPQSHHSPHTRQLHLTLPSPHGAGTAHLIKNPRDHSEKPSTIHQWRSRNRQCTHLHKKSLSSQKPIPPA